MTEYSGNWKTSAKTWLSNGHQRIWWWFKSRKDQREMTDLPKKEGYIISILHVTYLQYSISSQRYPPYCISYTFCLRYSLGRLEWWYAPYSTSSILYFLHTLLPPYSTSSILYFLHTLLPPYSTSSILYFLHTLYLPYSIYSIFYILHTQYPPRSIY